MVEMDSTGKREPDRVENGKATEHEFLEAVDVRLLRRKTFKNLIVVSLGFLFTFTAFQALQNLQSSIHSDAKLGLSSLVTVYVALILSCMFVPPLLIGKLGAKYTIMVSISGYVLYTLAMFYPRFGTLIPASLILGNAFHYLFDLPCCSSPRR